MQPLPTDGLQDKRPQMRCSECHNLRECYRAELLAMVATPLGTFERWRWICLTCVSHMVGEALRQD